MDEMWKKLQNGTDIRGIAIAAEGKAVNLTEDKVRAIAYGFITWLSVKTKKNTGDCKVAIGMDSRLSGPALKAALIEGLTREGCQVYDCQLGTTPGMFMTTVLDEYSCDGAIMVTASHLPFYYNGLKLFTKAGGCEKEDIQAVLELASQRITGTGSNKGTVQAANLIDSYAKVLVDTIRQGVNSKVNYERPLQGCKIVVDAGNGAGGFFAGKVLQPLGADTTGSQFLEPDGHFPNHAPNPENPAAMEAIKTAVLKNKADLGIIFDTDVDRAAVVSSDGDEINRNALIALLSAIVLKEHPQSYIVTDSITSTGLGEFIGQLGGVHHRFKRGYKNVINEAKRLNQEGKESHLAIETSGHAALKENYFLDDGAYLIAKILITMATLREQGLKIQSLIKDLKVPSESVDFRLGITVDAFKEYGTEVIQTIEEYAKTVEGWSLVPNNYEGVRITDSTPSGQGWFLLRLSLHEPVLALNIESDVPGGVAVMLSKLTPFFKKFEKLVYSFH